MGSHHLIRCAFPDKERERGRKRKRYGVRRVAHISCKDIWASNIYCIHTVSISSWIYSLHHQLLYLQLSCVVLHIINSCIYYILYTLYIFLCYAL